MTDEFYKSNLFGEEVNVGLEEAREEDEIDRGARESNLPAGRQGAFNIFLLTDAIAERDKRGAWVIYMKALASGMVAEEIFWRVMWGVKALTLAEKCASAAEAGLNPFVYKKMKSALKKWSPGGPEALSLRLVEGFHEARRGRGDIETLIEKAVLSL